MNEQVENKLDSLVKKVIKETTTKNPSLDFTSNVMSQIVVLQESKLTAYQPLISKNVWIVISVSFLALILFIIFGAETNSLGWFSTIDFSIVADNKITEALSGYTVSKTLMYAVVFFGLAWFVQIGLIKNYFNKRLEF